MKFLFLIVLVIAVLLVLRKVQSSRKNVQPPPSSRGPESMVKCAHCGVNQPVSESILTHGCYYCCSAHQHQAESRQD
ncbi:MAG: PP0621 family protein [Betaproteobacteria bacterium]